MPKGSLYKWDKLNDNAWIYGPSTANRAIVCRVNQARNSGNDEYRAELFPNGGRKGYVSPKLEPHEVKPTKRSHPEFLDFSKKIEKVVTEWRKTHARLLTVVDEKTSPKELIDVLSEHLLARFRKIPVFIKYESYQCLMDYWAETIQYDVYLVVANEWMEAGWPRRYYGEPTHLYRCNHNPVVGWLMCAQ